MKYSNYVAKHTTYLNRTLTTSTQWCGFYFPEWIWNGVADKFQAIFFHKHFKNSPGCMFQILEHQMCVYASLRLIELAGVAKS